MKLRRIVPLFALALALPVSAQPYPTKPVRVLIGYAAGSSTDIVGRVMADRLGANWKQTVIVENRGAAAGNVAADMAAKYAGAVNTVLVRPKRASVNSVTIPVRTPRAGAGLVAFRRVIAR